MSALVFVLFLASFIEKVTEKFFGNFKALKGCPMEVISALMGIGLCFGFRIDLIGFVGFEGAYPEWLGMVLSGVIVGAGANTIHKFVKPSEKW